MGIITENLNVFPNYGVFKDEKAIQVSLTIKLDSNRAADIVDLNYTEYADLCETRLDYWDNLIVLHWKILQNCAFLVKSGVKL